MAPFSSFCIISKTPLWLLQFAYIYECMFDSK